MMADDTALPTSAALAHLLVAGALPGETAGFGAADAASAADLARRALTARRGRAAGIEIESSATPRRMLRLAVAGDDMPFLVDSIAAAVAAEGLTIDRILHPVLSLGDQPISLIYMETERADAKARHAIAARITATLADVRAAVDDWRALTGALDATARAMPADEGRALVDWFRAGKLTLLGSARYPADGTIIDPLGIAATLGNAVLAPPQRMKARRWLDAHPGEVMLVKSNQIATVHRRAPIDLIVVAAGDGVIIHAALWTSAALATPPADVPVLRQRLTAIAARHGFSAAGHAGKALEHALTALPRDVLLAIDCATLERLALTAMSLADRPRAELVLASDALDRHLFGFVWLPRDELTTARRIAIGAMVGEAADAVLLSWSIDLGDGEVALIRYTFDRRTSTRAPDAAALKLALDRMIRGWPEAVEVALGTMMEPGRAARLALRYADAFPLPYRSGAGPEEAALDIVRLHALRDGDAREVRLYRNDDDSHQRLRLKLYSMAPVMLSDAVPALENFGFRVVEEMTTAVGSGRLGQVHRFVLEVDADAAAVLARATVVEQTIATVLAGGAESDRFNALVVAARFNPRSVVLLRALYRYLRQTGVGYGLVAFVDALQRHAPITRAVVDLFAARHDPATAERATAQAQAEATIEQGLAQVAAIDDDRILRLLRAVVRAMLRTNFYTTAGAGALAFKFDSALVPGLPAPVPWREIWVYSARVEGIHLRAGPVARGGLRWSDRRDDFRTEVLGLMKAQRVKNAVIVPTGAKGGFYPKALPPAADRDAWLAEGTASYRIFIDTLLSLTDNLVYGRVVHPAGMIIHDADDPYFVVAADKGTATFSDIANEIAIAHNFWLGDAFASGGSVGYDHKAMGITAKGAWISVQRHFAELGTDVQTQSIRIVGCGDMSGDVFGNGMLLSKTVKLIAAFDHRHVFIDPDPDASISWAERARLFALPRSSWGDYDPALISAGGGVWPRSAKSVALSPAARAALGITATELEPMALITAILRAPADLIWFGGIGTYVKAASESNGQVGDPANDGLRVDAEDMRARVIGEGANLGVTQAARIAFSLAGGRINTDFIDNSAGVDCSDHEVNIKIALNAEVVAGTLTTAARNQLLAAMTDAVAGLVLEDNRLQTLALSIAERGGAGAVPSLIRLIETFEASGRLDRTVEGLPSNDLLGRRAQDGHGLTRPELAVLLATAKLALQEAIEHNALATDAAMLPELRAAFPAGMRADHNGAIAQHRLAREIVATQIANRLVNRMGLIHPFELAEEEGASIGDVAAAFAVAEALFDVGPLWAAIDVDPMSEAARLLLFEQIAVELRAAMADLLRGSVPARSVGDTIAALAPGIAGLDAQIGALLRDEVRTQAEAFAARLSAAGAPPALVTRVVRLAELDGAVGIAGLASQSGNDAIALTHAFGTLGAALGLDWAQGAAMRATPTDPWERLLVAGLARDYQQMRLEFLARHAAAPEAGVDAWIATHGNRIADFRRLTDRARIAASATPAMLAQIAGQARVLLARP